MSTGRVAKIGSRREVNKSSDGRRVRVLSNAAALLTEKLICGRQTCPRLSRERCDGFFFSNVGAVTRVRLDAVFDSRDSPSTLATLAKNPRHLPRYVSLPSLLRFVSSSPMRAAAEARARARAFVSNRFALLRVSLCL